MSNDTLVIDSSILLGELKQAKQEMGQVIESIRQIAQHTNLLSLNSAIEAARAGEEGTKIHGYAHTSGYNAYKGKNWSALVSETL